MFARLLKSELYLTKIPNWSQRRAASQTVVSVTLAKKKNNLHSFSFGRSPLHPYRLTFDCVNLSQLCPINLYPQKMPPAQ